MHNKLGTILLGLLVTCIFSVTVRAAEVTYYHTDAMGTPLAITDAKGKVVWKGDYLPFGEEHDIVISPDKNNRRFVGKERDEESGLHYFGARYMDEKNGRFISPDSVYEVDPETSRTNTALLANPLRLNRYVYGLNNPYRYVDPDGNFPILVAALIGAAALYLQSPDVANAPTNSSSQTYQSHGGVSIVAGTLGGAGLRQAAVVARSVPGGLSKEAQKGIRSLEKRIAEHETKLTDFKANPTVRPGMENQPEAVIKAAQESRIRHLNKEIQTFRENIEKLKGGQ